MRVEASDGDSPLTSYAQVFRIELVNARDRHAGEACIKMLLGKVEAALREAIKGQK